MDIYLPNDFYDLRSDLPDWSDAPQENGHKPELHEDSADPSWQAI